MKITDNTTETFQYRGHVVEIKWVCGTAVYDCPSLELFSYSSERGIVQAIGRKLGNKKQNLMEPCRVCGNRNCPNCEAL